MSSLIKKSGEARAAKKLKDLQDRGGESYQVTAPSREQNRPVADEGAETMRKFMEALGLPADQEQAPPPIPERRITLDPEVFSPRQSSSGNLSRSSLLLPFPSSFPRFPCPSGARKARPSRPPFIPGTNPPRKTKAQPSRGTPDLARRPEGRHHPLGNPRPAPSPPPARTLTLRFFRFSRGAMMSD